MYTKEQIEEATVSYYTGEETGITDSDYDKAFAVHFPGIEPLDLFREKTKNSAGGKKVNLQYPMLSLAKATKVSELAAWLRKAHSAGATSIELFPKWDGLAVQVVVAHGKLVSATTRGNGTVGEDVTELFRRIPGATKLRDGVYGVEVVMTHTSFEMARKEKDYTSPRNAASGILQRSVDTHGHLAKYLSIRAHWTFFKAPVEVDLYQSTSAEALETLLKAYNEHTHVSLQEQLSDVDTDGVVIVAKDGNGILKSMGEGTTTPHWAVAWKFETETQETTLLDVEWEQNRTKVTPVAVFHPPVYFGQVKVEKASLHNIDIIRNLGLAIGDKILVERAGEVIPQVVEVIERPAGRIEIESPEKAEVTTEHKVKLIADVFDIKGMGPAVQAQVAQSAEGFDGTPLEPLKLMTFISNALTAEKLQVEFESFGEASATKLRTAIEYSFSESKPEQWLAALGLPGMGKRKWASILRQSGGVASLMTDLDGPYEGVGEVMQQIMLDNEEAITEVCSYLVHIGRDSEAVISNVIGSLAGVKCVVTGKVGINSRNEVHALLESYGAEVQGSVSKTTTVLVVGGEPNTPSSKVVKAEKLGIPVVYCNNIDELEKAIKAVL